jgi:FkbM family methyltransferase
MIRRFRGFLRPILGRDRAGWRVVRSTRLRRWLFRDSIDNLIYSLLISRDRVFFIQIGSNDGCRGDPLWTFRRYPNWHGILVEPVEYVFRRLVTNYAPWADRVAFENAAISNGDTSRPFYRFAESPDLPVGYDQLGSFDRQLLEACAQSAGRAHHIIGSPVDCLTFAELCAKHQVNALDLLHIDAERSDAEILGQVDFHRHRPAVLIYEHVYLAEHEQKTLKHRLDDAGYQLRPIGDDTVGVSRDGLATLPALRRVWLSMMSAAAHG